MEATHTGGLVTPGAVGGTLGAEIMLAQLAPPDLVLRHHVAALVAAGAVPVVQADERGIGVVGPQHGDNEREEIEHASFPERRLNGGPGVPGAEPLLADVWVRNGVV